MSGAVANRSGDAREDSHLKIDHQNAMPTTQTESTRPVVGMATIVDEDSAQSHKCGFRNFSECPGRPIRTLNEELIQICFHGTFPQSRGRLWQIGFCKFRQARVPSGNLPPKGHVLCPGCVYLS